eukprot:TRINITY_DN6199_c0_g1_i1.p1 TRINITY_DN6199_c0_g1~~TRINITY_DN6199_c0_g1_i1.p1  ORF type:complete len:269 (+),score=53.86 TRINITY_DN6199_c0_g1_i1:90-896(+)
MAAELAAQHHLNKGPAAIRDLYYLGLIFGLKHKNANLRNRLLASGERFLALGRRIRSSASASAAASAATSAASSASTPSLPSYSRSSYPSTKSSASHPFDLVELKYPMHEANKSTRVFAEQHNETKIDEQAQGQITHLREQLDLSLKQLDQSQTEIAKLKAQIQGFDVERAQLERRVRHLTGEDVDSAPVEVLRELEHAMTYSLARVRRAIEDRVSKLDRCVICSERAKEAVIYPCLHLCSCLQCLSRLQKCPICRERIHSTLRVYVT